MYLDCHQLYLKNLSCGTIYLGQLEGSWAPHKFIWQENCWLLMTAGVRTKTTQNTSDPRTQERQQVVVTITLAARKPPVPASQGSTTLNKAVNGC